MFNVYHLRMHTYLREMEHTRQNEKRYLIPFV